MFCIRMDGAPVKHTLPRIAKRPWAVALAAATLLLAIAGFYIWRGGSTGLGLPEKPAIAILPFKNLGEDAKWDRLADVMTEDVITG